TPSGTACEICAAFCHPSQSRVGFADPTPMKELRSSSNFNPESSGCKRSVRTSETMASTEDDEIVGASDWLAIAQRTDTSGGNPYERSPFEAAVSAASESIKAVHRVS